ncbi:MAG: hypothetical protein CVT84_13865 [Alphaproteobacteria bacterium HGW-Alphaproteobacteria-6]|nr:MAG: hypothetical protein CVT84_13865 [Alphaproteobacteria bacterium HGW-Alphaproteobacteria-6]
MPRLDEIPPGRAPAIDGYGPGFFRIGGRVMRGAVIVTETGAGPWAGLADAAPLIALAGRIDVLLIGTGATITHLPAGLRNAIEAAGIGLEAMDSAAAARGYNLLLAEGRRVAAALIPVGPAAGEAGPGAC